MIKRITDEDFNKLPDKNKKRIQEVRGKYGDNKWWNSDDVRVIGYYQLKENYLITDFGTFHEGVEALLGRPVWTHEFGLNRDGLIAEAEKGFELIQSGESTETTPKYKAQKTAEMLSNLRDFAIKNNKKVIGVVV